MKIVRKSSLQTLQSVLLRMLKELISTSFCITEKSENIHISFILHSTETPFQIESMLAESNVLPHRKKKKKNQIFSASIILVVLFTIILNEALQIITSKLPDRTSAEAAVACRAVIGMEKKRVKNVIGNPSALPRCFHCMHASKLAWQTSYEIPPCLPSL